MIRKSLCFLTILGLVLAQLGAPATAAEPNIVLIQTDDQTLEQLYARDASGRLVMPNVVRRIARRGTSFDRYYVTYPICCPSRTSLLTGRYVHNHDVLINRPPFGYTKFRTTPEFHSNLATWLQSAGYRTMHVGKFMNFYGDRDPTEVPPGWTDWVTIVSEEGARRYYGYTLNVNGKLLGPLGDWDAVRVDPLTCAVALPGTSSACDYSSDVDTAFALDLIERHIGGSQPLYLQVDYTAPHVDLIGAIGPEPASRDLGSVGAARYRPIGYDERDVSEKPRFIRRFHRLSSRQRRTADIRYRLELESLRSVDLGVGRILDSLEAAGELDNTYVVFVSDNGQFHGEHRIAQGKYLPYEPVSHMPFAISGPGIVPGSHVGALAANIDLAPTLAALGGGAAVGADGRSLVPYLRDPELGSRRPILLEGYALPGWGAFNHKNVAPVLDYFGVVAERYKYVRYSYGDRELYDLAADPHELHSLAADPRYRDTVRWAQSLVNKLRNCRSGTCRIRSESIPGIDVDSRLRH